MEPKTRSRQKNWLGLKRIRPRLFEVRSGRLGVNLQLTLVDEYMVMRGVGRTAEAEDTLRISPFLRSTILGRTSRHIWVTDTTLQLMSCWENSVALGICNECQEKQVVDHKEKTHRNRNKRTRTKRKRTLVIKQDEG